MLDRGAAMHLDVAELRAFYLTPLGRITRQIVSHEVRALWPDVTAERLAGVGHATPYLRPFLAEAERVSAVMPAAEGVLHWPPEGPNLTTIAFEDQLPLPDMGLDKVLLVHILESAHDPFAVLRETWRILMPTGRVIAIVPYRSGAWARADHTPFGLGRPFSRFQLRQMMESALLEPVAVRRFLFVPPSRRRFILGATRVWERAGAVVPRFAGVLAIEAQKTVVRGVPVSNKARGLAIFAPGLKPVPRPAATAMESVSGEEETPPARQKGSRTTTAR